MCFFCRTINAISPVTSLRSSLQGSLLSACSRAESRIVIYSSVKVSDKRNSASYEFSASPRIWAYKSSKPHSSPPESRVVFSSPLFSTSVVLQRIHIVVLWPLYRIFLCRRICRIAKGAGGLKMRGFGVGDSRE
jgi:hypothetical protein